MKYKLTAIALAMISFAVIAGEKTYLWPAGMGPAREAHQIAAMTDVSRKERFNPDEWREPYLEWFDPPAAESAKGVCAVLISGGSYQNCCDVGLIKTWRERFTALGCQTVNLVYRTPRSEKREIYRSAWEDGQRAIRIVRAEAEKRGYSKVITVSMSAGSHLATLLATSSLTPAYEPIDDLDAVPANVDAALVFAMAYGMTDGAYGGPNARDGDGIDVKLDPIFKFDEKTPPMCFMHGGRDRYSPFASTFAYRELRKRKIPAEVHIAPDKPHGAWGLDRGIEFLVELGFLGKKAPAEDLIERYSSDDDRAVYAKEDVWPKGKMPDVQKNQTTPFIEWHIPSNLTTKAIQVIWSGGNYNHCDANRYEVAPIRRYLNAKGMAVVTLTYRVPRPAAPLAKHVTAWEDAQRAIRLIRAEAPKYGLDPKRIGVMGSSAGGHLAMMTTTTSRRRAYLPLDKEDEKTSASVQWGIAIYPAYGLTDGIDRPNKDGGNLDSARLAPEFAFDTATPPILFVHGDGDGWAAMNSVKAWEQLSRMGIQGELHTLVKRGHCFQKTAYPGTGSYTYMDRVWEFLTAKGFNK